MNQIDTSSWEPFLIDKFFEKKDLKILKADFDKRIDTSSERTEEFSLPLINAKDGNNGIMYYGREQDFESEEMCLGIVQNGAIATGNVYAHIGRTGVLWDAYIIKTKAKISTHTLSFIALILKKLLKEKYSYDNKAIWDKVRFNEIMLPSKNGIPDWDWMDNYMQKIEGKVKHIVNQLIKMGGKLIPPITSRWQTFHIGDIFKVCKPKVYHSHEVIENPEGIPYVVRSKYNNGMKCRVIDTFGDNANPAGVISFGSENSTFFYQKEKWCSGRDIYYVDTSGLSAYVCLFLATCFQKIADKYSYNYGLFPELLRKERIMLPMKNDKELDVEYMEQYMAMLMYRISKSVKADSIFGNSLVSDSVISEI